MSSVRWRQPDFYLPGYFRLQESWLAFISTGNRPEYRGGKECTTYSMGKFPSGWLSQCTSLVNNDEEVSEEDFNSRKEKWNQISSHFVTISYDLMTDITDTNIEILLNAGLSNFLKKESKKDLKPLEDMHTIE